MLVPVSNTFTSGEGSTGFYYISWKAGKQLVAMMLNLNIIRLQPTPHSNKHCIPQELKKGTHILHNI
jgi:hypothetical protein